METVLCNDLSDTFSKGAAPLTVPPRLGKLTFSSACSALGPSDDRFLSLAKLCRYLDCLSPKKSSGPDGISAMILKWLDCRAIGLLLVALNHCINLNYVPTIWKVSSVTFLRKDKAKSGVVGNYRPISLMANMGKLLERFYVEKLQ